jgi:polysulfide reductase-like protein
VSSTPGGYTPNSDSVGREGVQNFGDAKSAPTGTAGGRRGRRRGGRGEQPMVPDAEFTSYYGRPVVKAAPWTADIPAYLFAGGLAGGSALLGAGAELIDAPTLRRTGRFGALGALVASMVLLVHDLGRPSRFLNMLRVAKVTSPMSVGTWFLSAFGLPVGIAAVSELRGFLPRRLRWAAQLLGLLDRPAGLAAAALAPAVMSYTAVLLADTSTPTWHEGYREMPFVFVGSGAAAAGGLGLLIAPTRETAAAQRFAVGGALLELAAEHRMESSMGMVAEPLHKGTPGILMRCSRSLTAAGALGALLGRRNRAVSAASGAALLAGSVCTRFGIFHAGQESARDPKYTVVPQRKRRDEKAAADRA